MSLGFAQAEAVARAALDQAHQKRLAVAVAVCDANGRLVIFFKLDGSDAMSGHEAIGRAIAAAGSGGASERARRGPGQAATVAAEGPGFSNRPGGLPLLHHGDTVGGIGVCGGSDEQAVACARAGTKAVMVPPNEGCP